MWFVTDTAGTPRTRALASALRGVVDESPYGVRELARRMGISHTTLSQWINARRVPKVEDVATLLGAVEVTGDNRDRILDLARDASDPNWLTTGIPGVSHQLAGVMECERTATTITDWSPTLIPGLLQVGDYARAILGSGAGSRAEVETRVTLRLGRRDVLTRSKPARLVALIGEAAIRQRIGSPEVRAEQLRYVLKMIELETVTAQLVPIDAGWHAGLMGPFTLYEFEDAPAIVHLEHHRSGVFLYDEADVEAYKVAAAEVCAAAMSPEETAEFIAREIN